MESKEKSPIISREKLENATFIKVPERERLERLNAQIAYAKENSEFYKKHLDGYGNLTSLSELSQLPLIDMDMIRNEGSSMVCVRAGDIERIVTLKTSGTTGTAKRVFFSGSDIERTVSFFAEGMNWMCGYGDKVGDLMPCTTPDGVGDLLARGLERIGAVPLRIGLVMSAVDTAKTLAYAGARVLVALPWQARMLAVVCPELRPETVLLSGDFLPQSMYSFLEEVWGCNVLSHFGMTETGYGCALESFEHEGMFIRADEFCIEVIDPKTGRPAMPGETGELVITTLRREAMPMIRLRTRDLVRISPDGRRIMKIYGRISDLNRSKIEESLCGIRWLYDFSITGNNSIYAVVSEQAPDNWQGVLAETAGVRVTGERVDPENACPLAVAKRSSVGNVI